jgi:TIR domain
MDSVPKVFLSHASEDKERFVLRFAERLRAKGVDVWLDREMMPGDSLIDKIFEEGIGRADAVIVVVSTNSVHKPWVREELNAAVVKRIDKGSLLIPIVLDGCEVPVALRSTLYLRVTNPDDVETISDRVRDAVYRHSEKPPLGPIPSYARSRIAAFPTLSRVDSIILSLFAESCIRQGNDRANTEAAWKGAEAQSISRSEFLDSLSALEEAGYLREPGIASEIQPFFFVPMRVLEEFMASADPDFAAKVEAVASAAVNLDKPSDTQIANDLNMKQFVVRVILERLESESLLEIWRPAGPIVIVGGTTANLRRRVQSGAVVRGGGRWR